MSKSIRKNKKISKKELDDILARLIEKENFNSEEQVLDYIKNFEEYNKKFPAMSKEEADSDKLLSKAYKYKKEGRKGIELAREAIEIYPENSDAYLFLADSSKDMDEAQKLYETAARLRKNKLGKKFFKTMKGRFWQHIEARPYLFALEGVAECLFFKNEFDRAVKVLEEMLELNPYDNLEIHYMLLTALVGLDDLSKYERFIKENKYEENVFFDYTNALYHFKKYGPMIKTKLELQKAYKYNPFVPYFLFNVEDMIEEKSKPKRGTIVDDAVDYVVYAMGVWYHTEGAIEWLLDFIENIDEIS